MDPAGYLQRLGPGGRQAPALDGLGALGALDAALARWFGIPAVEAAAREERTR